MLNSFVKKNYWYPLPEIPSLCITFSLRQGPVTNKWKKNPIFPPSQGTFKGTFAQGFHYLLTFKSLYIFLNKILHINFLFNFLVILYIFYLHHLYLFQGTFGPIGALATILDNPVLRTVTFFGSQRAHTTQAKKGYCVHLQKSISNTSIAAVYAVQRV